MNHPPWLPLREPPKTGSIPTHRTSKFSEANSGEEGDIVEIQPVGENAAEQYHWRPFRSTWLRKRTKPNGKAGINQPVKNILESP